MNNTARSAALCNASVSEALPTEAFAFASATCYGEGLDEIMACAVAFFVETFMPIAIDEAMASAIREAYDMGWLTPAQGLQVSAFFADDEQRRSLANAAKADAAGFAGWLHS